MLEGGGGATLWLLVVVVGWARGAIDVAQHHPNAEIGNTGITRELKRQRLSEFDDHGELLELLKSVKGHRLDTWFTNRGRYKRRGRRKFRS